MTFTLLCALVNFIGCVVVFRMRLARLTRYGMGPMTGYTSTAIETIFIVAVWPLTLIVWAVEHEVVRAVKEGRK